ncbi:MAG: hypothetical protein A2321_01710 [Omnitrophica WOR_2 bacterium RIFOXYB2_FULL_45_11]|nr:MAG: hypothetical protein A2321_01710 [Omnitrophica WOR_2 bacterium RIFOXYB2_FULL_45_11]
MRKEVFLLSTLALGAALSGCTTTQKGAALGGLGGAALGGLGGAALGGIIGHQSGHGVEGALIGAGAGAVGGALVGEQMDKKFCPVCGAEYTSGVQYCSKDGTELKLKQK